MKSVRCTGVSAACASEVINLANAAAVGSEPGGVGMY